MRTLFKTEIAGLEIKLEMRGTDVERARFRTTYGREVNDHQQYADAASALGAIIMHACILDGRAS